MNRTFEVTDGDRSAPYSVRWVEETEKWGVKHFSTYKAGQTFYIKKQAENPWTIFCLDLTSPDVTMKEAKP